MQYRVDVNGAATGTAATDCSSEVSQLITLF